MRSALIKIFIGLIICQLLHLQVNAQRVQYSRERIKLPYYDGMQLLANVAGYHHLVFFTINQQPVIHLFDEQLQLKTKRNLPFVLRQSGNLNIVRFHNFYYLFLHEPRDNQYQLWKVLPNGQAFNHSAMLQQLVDTMLPKNSASLQLINQQERLFLLASTYYGDLDQIGSSVTEIDEQFNPISTEKILFPFKRLEEQVRQVMLAGDRLLVLKTTNDTAGHSLQLISAHFKTGVLLTSVFNSGAYPFTAPGFKYQTGDSTILVYGQVNNTVFINQLDTQLLEQVPPFQKNLFHKDIFTNFLLVGGQHPRWLTMRLHSFRPQNYRRNNTLQFDDTAGDWAIQQEEASPNLAGFTREPQAIRFTYFNNRLRLVKDSVVKNDKSRYTLLGSSAAQAVIHNKPYLFLHQVFFDTRHGIAMVRTDANNQLAATDIRVYEKYRYSLAQLQAVNNRYAIVPYINKKEMGLAKITIDDF